MRKSIQELIVEGGDYLDERGYKKKSQAVYRRAWRLLEEWCLDRGKHLPSSEDVEAFISEGWLDLGSAGYAKQLRRAVRVLVEYGETGVWHGPYHATRIKLPECHREAWERYRAHVAASGVKERTVYHKAHLLKGFLNFLALERGVDDVSAMSAEDALAYADSLSRYALSTRADMLFLLREYLRFAVAEYGLDPELADLFPTILASADDVLPSVYTADEIKALVEAARHAEGACRRRDLAVVMLAVTTGMRVGDIKELRLDGIDWRKGQASFVQQKGGRRNVVPLVPECALALADYIRSERPDVDDPRVFIVPQAPYGPYSGYNSFHAIVSRCFEEAGVDAGGRHHGMHSLRHSLAVGMLTQKAPYPVVSGVLGHECANTTKRYLRVDVEALRPLCLEVPHVRA